ncbi:RDD family protein [Kurthia massiliensis]|uniref:RDD family protein n=1 Tax=Kurthia massiliensis TaxID=1033739 RepID=UPI000287D017|nr:RDD family protein [Kurthia massiliensis]
MKCPSCEAPTNQHANFCASCGQPLQQSTAALDRTYASFGKRLGAYVIDSVIIAIPGIMLNGILDMFYVSMFIVSMLYFTIMEQTSQRATLGKKWLHVVVVDEQGGTITVGQSLMRNFVKTIFAYGGFVALFTKKNQALHDFLPKTYVLDTATHAVAAPKTASTQQSVVAETQAPVQKVSSTDHTKDVNFGEISRKVKKGLSNMPGITIMNDAVMSLSGVRKQMEYLKEEPKEPINWLQYYECLATYDKMKLGVSWFRLVTNPASFVISKGISTGLNVADDEYEKFDPISCLKKAVVLSHEKIKVGPYEPFDIAILAKAYFYLGINEEDVTKKTNYVKKSIQYLSKAIELEKKQRFKAEYFFYLGQFYGAVPNEKLRVKSLNLSRKLGFVPACDVLKQMFRDKGMPEDEIKYIEIPLGETHIDTFRLTYKPKLEKKLENLVDGVVKGQKEKFVKTKQTLQSMK